MDFCKVALILSYHGKINRKFLFLASFGRIIDHDCVYPFSHRIKDDNQLLDRHWYDHVKQHKDQNKFGGKHFLRSVFVKVAIGQQISKHIYKN